MVFLIYQSPLDNHLGNFEMSSQILNFVIIRSNHRDTEFAEEAQSFNE